MGLQCGPGGPRPSTRVRTGLWYGVRVTPYCGTPIGSRTARGADRGGHGARTDGRKPAAPVSKRAHRPPRSRAGIRRIDACGPRITVPILPRVFDRRTTVPADAPQARRSDRKHWAAWTWPGRCPTDSQSAYRPLPATAAEAEASARTNPGHGGARRAVWFNAASPVPRRPCAASRSHRMARIPVGPRVPCSSTICGCGWG